MGSIAASAVPVREKTVTTSGSAAIAFSSANCIANDCSSDVDGTRNACMARFPSSRVGMNSRPSIVKPTTPIPSIKRALANTALGLRIAAWIAGSIRPRRTRMIAVSCSSSWSPSCPSLFAWSLGSLTSRAAIAGTKVKEKMNAPTRASMKVAAIGWKVLPSTPSNVRIGAKTNRMITWPNAAGRAIFLAESAATRSRSIALRGRPSSARLFPSISRVDSITITAPSTRMPKSSAPKLIRLPLIPNLFMPITANRNDSGITKAVMAAARRLPSSRNSTTTTSRAPSVRFLATVLTVELTSTLRSSTGSAKISAGRDSLTCARRSAAA